MHNTPDNINNNSSNNNKVHIPHSTLIDAIRSNALSNPDGLAYVFLKNGEVVTRRLTYKELDQTVQNLALWLQNQEIKSGDRVLLLYHQSLDYIIAFLACLYAGIIPIPAYPPSKKRIDDRTLNIIISSKAEAILCTDNILLNLNSDTGLKKFKKLSTDNIEISQSSFKPVEIKPNDLAFLQYTSGSTGTPKGIMIAHDNLVFTLIDLQQSAKCSKKSVMVSWLPLFHDLGLIYGALFPIYFGIPCYLFSPVDFVQKPLRWLEAITRYRGTHSASPNFAYEICVAKISDYERKKLDLSSWIYTINGAEPVSLSTIEKFNNHFKEQGLSSLTVSPGYGMAEMTLIAATVSSDEITSYLCLEKEAFRRNKIHILPEDKSKQTQAQVVVCCGKNHIGSSIIIVNPDTCEPAQADEIGEIWINGPSVAKGYWENPEATKNIFQATLKDDPYGTFFLRTGDLGFLYNGELYITGRIKEMLVIRGQNYYPQDIELTAQESHRFLRKGCGAVFSTSFENEDRLILLQEVNDKDIGILKGEEVLNALQKAISEEHGLRLHALLLIKAGSLPKTSSGKIQRVISREEFLKGEWTPKALWHNLSEITIQDNQVNQPNKADKITQIAQAGNIQRWLQTRLSEILNIPLYKIDPAEPTTVYGLDSMTAINLSKELSDKFNREIQPTIFFEFATIQTLSLYLVNSDSVIETNKDNRQMKFQIEDTINEHHKQIEARIKDEPIAIIGMACSFPCAENLENFYKLLHNGHCAISEVPSERWSKTGSSNNHWGGFIKDVKGFDAAFFGITPKEAASIDPQQRLLIETSWRALEQACIDPLSLAGSQTGVFIGLSAVDYQRMQIQQGIPPDVYYGTGNAFSIAANRLSYIFDFRGPSITIDTACSSSLVAVHQACEFLQHNESPLAIAGGVNIMLCPDIHDTFQQAGMLSPDGLCKTFDSRANGYVRGEGCGIVVLKRLSDAVKDKDFIWSVIHGAAINQDGRSNGLTAPNSHAQKELIASALDKSKIPAYYIGYVEAHGTGTSLGDPIEFNALKAAISDARRKTPCFVGSVKTNIGHLEAAAGIAGLIKTAMSLNYGEIFPSLHFKTPNPLLEWDDKVIQIPKKNQTWNEHKLETQEDEIKEHHINGRYAGISAFGFGGTNAHIILGYTDIYNAVQPKTLSSINKAKLSEPLNQPLSIITLSAKTDDALNNLALEYISYIKKHENVPLSDIAYTTQLCRPHFPHRLSIVAMDHYDIVEGLTSFIAKAPRKGVFRDKAELGTTLPIVFLFTGQGSQYPEMGIELYNHFPLFRDTIIECNRILSSYLREPLLSVLFPETDKSLIYNAEYVQPAIFAFEYALARLWQSFGIEPSVVMGHSLGEYVAACVAGVLTLEDGLMLVAERAKLMAGLPRKGGMLTVFSDLNTIESILLSNSTKFLSVLTIAAINGPKNIVVSGELLDIESLEHELNELNIESQRLKVSNAFHSPLVVPMLDQFEKFAMQINHDLPKIPLISNLTGTFISKIDGGYWKEHTREMVNFSGGILTLIGNGYRYFIEIGPRPILSYLGEAHLGGELCRWIPSLQSGQSNLKVLFGSVASLYTIGAVVNWQGLQIQKSRKVALPEYPFKRKSFWIPVPKQSNRLTNIQYVPIIKETQPELLSNTQYKLPNHNEKYPNMQNNQLNTENRQTQILLKLIEIASQVLEIEPDLIDKNTPLLEIGADSLMIAQVVRKIENQYGLRISIRQFFEELSTLSLLASYIEKQTPHTENRASLIEREETFFSKSNENYNKADSNAGNEYKTSADISNSNQKYSTDIVKENDAYFNVTAMERILDGQMDRVANALSDVVSQQLNFLREQGFAGRPSSFSPIQKEETGTGKTAKSRCSKQADIKSDNKVVGFDSKGQSDIQSDNKKSCKKQESSSQSALPAWKPKEINASFLTTQQQRHMTDFIQRYTRKTSGSKEFTQKYRKVLADNRVSLGFRLSIKEMVYPIVGTKAEGSKIWDIDGNCYIDITMGFGVNLFGHQPPFVLQAIEQQLAQTMQLGPQTALAGEVASLVCELTGMERAAFCNSGTEAVMIAMRLARTVTRRTKIVNFVMSYHGHFDGVLGEPEGGTTVPIAPGVCPGMVEDLIPLKYDDPNSIDFIKNHAHELAAVLVEPVQSRHPGLQPKAFLHQIRKITQDNGIILIFDEMITGFRIHPGGAQAYFGIEADIATYGKIVGGGMPIGVVSGKAFVMDSIDGGFWQYGDLSYPKAETTFSAGTFSKHPLSMAASRAVLTEIKRQGPKLQENLNSRTADLADTLNQWFKEINVPLQIDYFGSLFRFVHSGNLDMLYFHLTEKGLYIFELRNCFLSTAHSDEDIKFIISSVKKTVLELKEGGFFSTAELTKSKLKMETELEKTFKKKQAAIPCPLTQVQKHRLKMCRNNTTAVQESIVSVALYAAGGVDVEYAKKAAYKLMLRHQSLRMLMDSFSDQAFILPEIPISVISGAAPDVDSMMQLLEQQKPFDLINGPLWRWCIIKKAVDNIDISNSDGIIKPIQNSTVHYWVVLQIHHIITDGISINIILDEFVKLYNSEAKGYAVELPQARQWQDFIEYRNEYAESRERAEDSLFWMKKLAHGFKPASLPEDFTRSDIFPRPGAFYENSLSAEWLAKLKKTAKEQSCTPFMILAGCFTLMLHKTNINIDDNSDKKPLMAAFPVSGRFFPDSETMTGIVSHPLLLLTQIKPEHKNFVDYLNYVREELLNIYKHQQFSAFDVMAEYEQNQLEVQEWIKPDKSFKMPMIRFNLDRPQILYELNGVSLRYQSLPLRHVSVDLFLDVLEWDETWHLRFEYAEDIFTQERIQRFAESFVQLLRDISNDVNIGLGLPIATQKKCSCK